MPTKNRDVALAAEPSPEAGEGTKRLHLAITRMKKLRSQVKGGLVDTEPLSTGGESTGDRTWM